jgi:tetraacyldisaccharide 4'-kinase
MLSALYAEFARVRRARFGLPGRRRRLQRPVVSIGNLSVGGRGKTPTVAHVVQILRGMGERPAILTRGYKRQVTTDGVVVVHDGLSVRADLDRAGDEPLMLARSLGHTPVLVSADRYLAGRLAEVHLGVSVHVLDDGFQHLPLHRDIDLLIVSPSDLADPLTLPGGRLRESLSTAREADAVLVDATEPEEVSAIASQLGSPEAFSVTRRTHPPLRLDAFRESALLEPGTRVLAVAGIARPERFFDDARSLGLDLAGTMTFPDHHPYDANDVARIFGRARIHTAAAILTTEKDLARLLPHRPFPLRLAWLPLSVSVEPAGRFQEWLATQLARARNAAA